MTPRPLDEQTGLAAPAPSPVAEDTPYDAPELPRSRSLPVAEQRKGTGSETTKGADAVVADTDVTYRYHERPAKRVAVENDIDESSTRRTRPAIGPWSRSSR